MHYDASKRDHGLPHDPFKSLVVPRPIGWISTVAEDGTPNLAPYSFFNGISSNPPMVMFSSEGLKDSLRNAESCGEFVCSLVGWEQHIEMNKSSAPLRPDQSEFLSSGLKTAASQFVSVPRVAGTPAALECKLVETRQLKDISNQLTNNYMIIGQVVGVYINEAILTDGLVDMKKVRPVSRLGYMDYSTVDTVFSMIRPSA